LITNLLDRAEGEIMRTLYAVALALLAGFGHGAIAVQGLRAEAKPPAYYISEIVVRDIDPYLKEYLPKVRASVKAFGGKSLAGGDKIIPIEGDPPKHRIALVMFDSLDQLLAWRNSPQYKEDRKISDKYATVEAYAVEGVTD
jgi:uncharacterized protein (DUF1330 family)